MNYQVSKDDGGRPGLTCLLSFVCIAALLTKSLSAAEATGNSPQGSAEFINQNCADCHDSDLKEGGLDLTALEFSPKDPGNFATWVKVFDRASAGEMPPMDEPRPEPADLGAFTQSILNARETLVFAIRWPRKKARQVWACGGWR